LAKWTRGSAIKAELFGFDFRSPPLVCTRPSAPAAVRYLAATIGPITLLSAVA